MIIRQEIKKVIESYLMEEGIDYFIGGSEMFGWANRESDIDFFISCCDGQLIDLFQEFPSKTIIKNSAVPAYDANISAQYSFLGGFVHLNVFIDLLHSYELLKSEHEKVEKILNKNHDLKRVVTSLKRTTNIRGRDIYDILKRL